LELHSIQEKSDILVEQNKIENRIEICERGLKKEKKLLERASTNFKLEEFIKPDESDKSDNNIGEEYHKDSHRRLSRFSNSIINSTEDYNRFTTEDYRTTLEDLPKFSEGSKMMSTDRFTDRFTDRNFSYDVKVIVE
jgi:hypothetical protein